MDYKRSYDKDEKWEENDQEEFEEELRRIEKKINGNDGDDMNIDRAK